MSAPACTPLENFFQQNHLIALELNKASLSLERKTQEPSRRDRSKVQQAIC